MKPAIRPDAYKAPDREAWAKAHGADPHPATLLPFTEEREHVERLLQADLSTLDADEAHRLQDEIHMVCECVAALSNAPESAGCYFDHGQFWIYPVADPCNALP